PTKDLLERPDILRSVFIAGASSKSNGSRPGSKTKAKRKAPAADAPVVLECVEVSKTFGGIRAVDEAKLTLRQGQIVGLIGPNGSGKTTLMDCISGFLEIDGGRIVVNGQDVSELSPHERARAGLGRSFQEAKLFPSLTVSETVAVALERHLKS